MHDDIIKIVKELVTYPNDEEWFEFKENWYQTDGIGEYISSLSNAAAMKGKSEGYLFSLFNGKSKGSTMYAVRKFGNMCLLMALDQTLEGFFAGESVPVSKKLSEIFLQLHISEKSGRGVPKIIETYGKGVFEFRKNSIVVTIPFNRLDLGSATQVTTQVGNIEEMDEISKKILIFCSEPKSTKEITEYLGFKERKSTSRYLRMLLQNGRIAMMIPNKPNSSKQKYVTIK